MNKTLDTLISNTHRPAQMLSKLVAFDKSNTVKNDVAICGIQDDSRLIQEGDAYLCLPRSHNHADAYIKQAMASKAVAVIGIQQKIHSELTAIELNNMGDAGKVLRRWFGTDKTNVNCVGITGTDGKTSVAWMLREALQKKLGSAWSSGTLGWARTSNDIQDLGNTTPSMLNMHRILADADQQNIAAWVMEVSSHGIEQERVSGIPIQTAVWTSIGHDHLQDHGGYEAYIAIKASFIIQTIQQGGLGICNADHADIVRLITKKNIPVLWYAHGLYPTDKRIQADLTWEQELPGTMRIAYQGEEVLIEDIPEGDFHAENLAAAALVLCASFDVAAAELPSLLGHIKAPPGRMQPLEIGHWPVFIDYAHTPEALERCLQAARKLTRERVLVVFGCGGERDREKRPAMGRIAVQQADVVWITSDNPRNEIPEVIASEIESGMPKPYPAAVHLELDRKQAIATAIDDMQLGDTLIIAGKGHESYMEAGGVRTPWSDQLIAESSLHDKIGQEMSKCA